MKVGSLFSGIGGLELGLERAGMEVAWQVEIERFPRRVLQHHWPNVPLYEDVKDVGKHNLEPVDLICGGFPCQDLSVAGQRAGLAGERSGLFFEFIRIVEELTPLWVLIENVPGLLSSYEGRDMGTVLGALAELGYGYAYRVLDAQYFGVAQRRRRVFIVGCLGDWRSATEVLFEPESCERDTPPRRTAGRVSPTIPASGAGTSRTGNERTEADFLVTPLLEIGARTNSDGYRDGDGIGKGGDPMYTLQASKQHGVAFGYQGREDLAHALRSHASRADKPSSSTYVTSWDSQRRRVYGAVRRLTPLECERLQGFPDYWTAIDGDETPDTPRYKAIGNAVAVPVAEWIGRRIVAVEARGSA